MFERMSTGSVEKDGSLLARINDRVALVMRSAMLDLVRAGRTPEIVALLAGILGEEKAVRAVERFVAWTREQRLID